MKPSAVVEKFAPIEKVTPAKYVDFYEDGTIYRGWWKEFPQEIEKKVCCFRYYYTVTTSSHMLATSNCSRSHICTHYKSIGVNLLARCAKDCVFYHFLPILDSPMPVNIGLTWFMLFKSLLATQSDFQSWWRFALTFKWLVPARCPECDTQERFNVNV